jgi:glycosyltransferase involved in cell wall biosynthesis
VSEFPSALRPTVRTAYGNPGWPLASVIITSSAGRLGFLKEAVQAALGQQYRPLEVVIVESGSKEAEGWLRRCAPAAGQHVVYRSIPEGSPGRAGNAGLQLATGALVTFLPDDAVLFDRHVDRLAAALFGRPELGAAYGVAYEVPTWIESTQPLRYREVDRYIVFRQPFSRALLSARNFLPLQCVVFRRSLYEECGGFDERLGGGVEDWDLWRRYSAAAGFALVDDVTSMHRVPATGREAAVQFRELSRGRAILEELDRQRQQALAGTQGPSGTTAALSFGSFWDDRLTRVLAANRWLFGVYWHGRRLYYRMRQSS